MRYLTVSEYGTFLGLSGERLIVKQNGTQIKELPLSRLRTICVLKRGVSVSGDLILSCSLRGIRILFLDWKGQAVSAVLGQNQHAVVSLRKSQFDFIKDEKLCCDVSKKIILSKVRNQRAVVLYFSKYQLKNNEELTSVVGKFVTSVNQIITQLKNIQGPQWKTTLFGLEGKAAVLYWNLLSSLSMLPHDFECREGRGANSITNKALNYGYAILASFLLSAVDNAGFEMYAGFFHVDRPGKPSLVLDLMEEYRAWVVDRVVIKLRSRLESAKEFDSSIKKAISDEIYNTMATRYSYNKKKVKLENIIQRQVYRLSGVISEKGNYKGYSFKW